MAPEIRIGVMTTAGRERYLERTLASLDRNGIVPTVYKDLAAGSLGNALAARGEMHRDDRDGWGWGLLIEDDAIAAGGLRGALELATKELSDAPIVSLYWTRAAARTPGALTRGYVWRPGSEFSASVALLARAGFYRDFETYVFTEGARRLLLQGHPEFARSHDYLLRLYLESKGLDFVAVAPTWFQHIGRSSTLRHPWRAYGRERQSETFPGEDFDLARHYAARWGWGP